MAKKKSLFQKFWKLTFGKKFGAADITFLIIIVLYPIYLYYNAQEGFVLVNPGFDAIFSLVGSWIFGGVVLSFFIRRFQKRVKK